MSAVRGWRRPFSVWRARRTKAGQPGCIRSFRTFFPKRAVASVVGFGGMLASFLSMGFFYLVGHVLQGEGTYKSIMLICGSAYLVAWTIFHLGVPKIKPVKI